ncbi:MAG: hypothetical protein ACRDQW_01185 [Haloechinothrix sp.]
MTQRTEQQQQRLTATSQQVVAKLQTFYDGLTTDEQEVLNLAFSHLLADEADDDASGHAHAILVRVIAKSIIFAIDRLASNSNVAQSVPNLDYSHFGEDTTPR